MRALSALTVANIKSFVRDRAALFWTVAFPLIFILLFGFIFQGGGNSGLSIAWADEDGTPASAQLRTAFEAAGSELTDAEQDRLKRLPTANLDAYRLYVRGRTRLEPRTEADLKAAVRLFRSAIDQDEATLLSGDLR